MKIKKIETNTTKAKAILLIAVFILSMIPMVPMASAQDAISTYYVDPESTVGGSGSSPATTGANRAFITITLALAAVDEIDEEIIVATGTYTAALGESFPFTITPEMEGLTLTGDTDHPENVIIDTSTRAFDIKPGADTVTVEGFTINQEIWIWYDTTGVKVKNNAFIAPHGGVILSSEISTNLFVTAATIKDNTFTDTSIAIVIRSGATNNLMSNNIMTGVEWEGISIDGGATSYVTSGNKIIGNTITDNNIGIGLFVGPGTKVLFYDNLIADNTISGNVLDGINIEDALEITKLVITGNDITGNTEDGIHIGNLGTNWDALSIINHNNIEGNLKYGIDSVLADGVDAQYNWWGDQAGPRIDPVATPSADFAELWFGVGDRLDMVEKPDYAPWSSAALEFPLADPIVSADLPATTNKWDSGNTGDELTISGMDATPGGLVKVYWDEVHAWDGTAGYLGEVYASAILPYTYSVENTVPESIEGVHGIVVKDMEGTELATIPFIVMPEITLDPDSGIEEDKITVTGTGFAAESEITLSGLDGITTVPSTVNTDEFGSFTCEFDIPEDATEGTYTITAKDEDDNPATDELEVGTCITLTPETGLIGTTVTIEGRGFKSEGTVDIRWYLGEEEYFITLVDEYDLDANGDFSTTFDVPLVTVPSAPGDEYTVEAIDNDEEPTSIQVTFMVIDEASIELDTDEGYPEDDLTVDGIWFTASSTVTITFDGVELATSVSTGSSGSFSETVEIPEDAVPGDYTVTATDAEDVTASETYTVLPPAAVVINTRATEYMPGDTVTFYINATVVMGITIDIKDPSEYPFTTISITDEFESGSSVIYDDWTESGGGFVVTYEDASFILPSDATTGLWNWTADYLIEGEDARSSALFTVGEADEPDEPEPEPVTDISLSVGWNLVSLPVIPDDSAIEVVLAGVVGVESVWSYDAGVWSNYNPVGPGDLTEMVDGQGYWISMSASATLAVSGNEMPTDPFDPLPAYHVVEGYNLVGFKSTTPMTVSEYLTGVSYARVYEFITGYNALSADEDMTPGRGYWIAVSADGTIYP